MEPYWSLIGAEKRKKDSQKVSVPEACRAICPTTECLGKGGGSIGEGGDGREGKTRRHWGFAQKKN